MELSEKIRACRRKAGLSQEALAERLGVSRQAVGKWENGEAAPEIGKLLALAREFGVSTDWLLSEEAPAPEPAEELPSPSKAEAAAEKTEDTLGRAVEKLPGVLGRLVKRFGWLYGLYQALGGLVLCLFGGLVRAMGVSAGRMTGDLFSFGTAMGEVTFYDEAGNVMDPGKIPREMREAISNAVGIPSPPSVQTASPFHVMGNFLLVIGGVILLAGLLLAWYLWRLGRKPGNEED